MLDISDLKDQLFETYATAASKKISGALHLEQLLQGKLTLPPHAAQEIGPEFSWASDPLHDANWRFQFHTLLWLDNLRECSTELSSDEGLALYARLLRDWIEKNPVDEPPSDYSWFDMAVGLRAIVLVQALAALGPLEWLIKSLETHGQHLADPANYEGKGNHSLHQDMGLIVLGQLLERPDWLETARLRIEKMFNEAIDSEGVSREGSIDYQYRNYRWYDEAARRLNAANVRLPDSMQKTLPKMPEFMAHATGPSTHYAMLGDTLLHRAPVIQGTQTEWVKDLSKAPTNNVAVFRAGYLFARNAWRTWTDDPSTTYLTMRFGPGRSTAVHGHEDAGSITFDAYGERLLCDSGLYAYEAGDDRLFFRGRSAHNVIDVPGRPYYPSAESPLIAYQTTSDHVMATVEVRGIKGVVWHRTVLHSLKHGYIVVDDRISGKEDAEVMQRWQLPADATVRFQPEDGHHTAVATSGVALRLTPLGYSPKVQVNYGSESPIAGWRSDDYRKKYPSPELAFVQVGSSLRFSTLIQAAADNAESWVYPTEITRSSKFLRLQLTGKEFSEGVTLSSLDMSIS